MKLGTSNSVRYVCHTGTLASSTARAGTSCEKEQRRIRNSSSTRWTSFLFPTTSLRKDELTDTNYYIKKKRPHGHRYGKNTTSPIHSRRSAKRSTSRTEEICRQMDDLADEDHTHHLTREEIDDYRSNWWIRSNKIGSDTMPIRHRSDFKQALSTLRQLKEREEGAQRNQQWAQSSSSSSWGSWQGSWWAPYSYESHHGDEPSTD